VKALGLFYAALLLLGIFLLDPIFEIPIESVPTLSLMR
jgi:hypothetical protein